MAAKVRLGDLREAAAQYGQRMRRAPAGARGSIAPDTLVYREGESLMVATPFLTSSVTVIDGRFPGEVSVQPKAFSDMLNECAKLWKDVGGDAAEVFLSYAKGAVTVKWTDGKAARSRSMPARQTD